MTLGYYYLLGGTIRLYLLIRVSQVRDLHGLRSKMKRRTREQDNSRQITSQKFLWLNPVYYTIYPCLNGVQGVVGSNPTTPTIGVKNPYS